MNPALVLCAIDTAALEIDAANPSQAIAIAVRVAAMLDTLQGLAEVRETLGLEASPQWEAWLTFTVCRGFGCRTVFDRHRAICGKGNQIALYATRKISRALQGRFRADDRSFSMGLVTLLASALKSRSRQPRPALAAPSPPASPSPAPTPQSEGGRPPG